MTRAEIKAAEEATARHRIKDPMREVGARARDVNDRNHSYRAFAIGWIGGAVKRGPLAEKPARAVEDVRRVLDVLDELMAEPFVIVPPAPEVPR